jgi:microcin C transport system substrate-binding protein
MVKKVCICIFFSFLVWACEGPVQTPVQISDENILVSGTASMPNSLNVYIDYNSLSIEIASLLYEPLCELDWETLEVRGLLAGSWDISDDKMTYTFTLNDRARWADGSPVTTDDVMFTYQIIMNPENLTGLFRTSYEQDFEDVYAIDEKRVVFKARKKRWTSFISAYSFVVLPKKAFEGKDFNRDFNLFLPPGSGPYKIEDIKTDRYVQLKKRGEYWGSDLAQKQHSCNFERIKYKFIQEDAIRFEALKKGDIDFTPVYSAYYWIRMTEKEIPQQIEKNWILPKRVWNYKPEGFQAFYFNLRRPLFQDRRVRKALALLLDVDLINEKIMYDQYEPLRSYFPMYFNNDNNLPLIGYNPEEARKLLSLAGWNNVDSDGVLINENGKRCEIEFTYSSQSVEKHLTIFKEECEKVGVRINLNLEAPSSTRKKIFTDYEYDMTWISWGGTPFPGIEDLWRSDFAEEPNTNNIAGYKNKELDALLDVYLEEFDADKRRALMKKIDMILTEDIPTILLWYAPNVRLLYWNKLGMQPTILKKHADEATIPADWWMDTNKREVLKEAVKRNTTLPAEPVQIYYDAKLTPEG